MNLGRAIVLLVLFGVGGCSSTLPYDSPRTTDGEPIENVAAEDDTGSPRDTYTETGFPKDTDTPSFRETAVSSDTGNPTDGATDTAVTTFYEGFEGGTVFKEIPYPMGDLHPCLFPDGVSFSNNGERHILEMLCYDEAILAIDPALPENEYVITVAWSTGVDNDTWSDCERSGFHETYGASCIAPNRIIAVNGELVYELPGPLSNYSETTALSHSGAIEELILGVATAGENQPYITRYDYVEITSASR